MSYLNHRFSLLSVFCLALLQFAVNPLSVRADWPSFRGPWNNGYASAPDHNKPIGLPLQWDITNHQNIKWIIETPHLGWSTPAVMDGKVWMTTATLEGHDSFVLCVDADTGKMLLNQKLFHCDQPEPLGGALGVNCYATPSPVVESGRVYVHFGSYGTACLDAKTYKVLWERKDLPCRHYRGPSSSPILFENMLILTLDGVDLQYLTALDKTTGKTIWRTDRNVAWNDQDDPSPMVREGDRRKAHSTPVVITYNGKQQLLSSGAKAAFAYDPRTGKEIWRIHHNSFSSAPVPFYNQGIAYFVTGSGKTEFVAVKVDGKGDVTDTHIVWRTDVSVAKTASPILVDDLIYMVTDDSIITCRELANGKEVWRERVGGKFAASPIYGDGRLYYSNQQGKTFVIKPGRKFEVLATNNLPGGFMASPAVSGKAIFLRTKTHLARVEAK
jgi:outer membrane protein assembly factor BamB